MPQSLLFYGNDLESQYTLAKEIARLLNCKENKADDCQCLNCKWIRDDEGNISGLNQQNFQAETANSLLKIIEEPQSGVTFIFLCRYIDDLLPTIISRCQCFFVPARADSIKYECNLINGVFENYWTFDRKDVFDISQKLQDLAKENSAQTVLESIQNYLLNILKQNPKRVAFIEHIKILEDAKTQAKLGIKPVNIFDDVCLKLIK